jgi:hypothetical protein
VKKVLQLVQTEDVEVTFSTTRSLLDVNKDTKLHRIGLRPLAVDDLALAFNPYVQELVDGKLPGRTPDCLEPDGKRSPRFIGHPQVPVNGRGSEAAAAQLCHDEILTHLPYLIVIRLGRQLLPSTSLPRK